MVPPTRPSAAPAVTPRHGPLDVERLGPGGVLLIPPLALGYAVLAFAAYELFGALSIGVTFFPPAGLTFVAFLLLPRRVWPSVVAAIVIGELGVDLAHGQGLWWSLGWAAANTLEPLVGASVARAITLVMAFSRRFVLAFLVGGLLVGPAVGASVGASVLHRANQVAWVDAFPDIWIGDALGVLVVAPLVLVLVRTDDFVSRRTRTVDMVVVAVVSAAVTFGFVLAENLPLGYAAIPLLAVPAARYSAREVAIAGAVLASVLTAATARGRGPWAMQTAGETHAELVQQQAFLLVALGSAWFLKLEVVERVKAVTAAKASEAELDAQHRVALTLQHAMLPTALQALPGTRMAGRYLPATHALEVGGDWYDVVGSDDGRTAMVVIGDVAGHGLNAAATMGNLAAASRALAYAGLGPAELIDRLDRLAAQDGEATMTTMVCALVDVEAGTLRYAIAGHPPPLLRAADGRTSWLDDAAAPPLGVGYRLPRAEALIGLPRGSTLLFYTDGLVEQRRLPLDPRLDALASAFAADSCADVDLLCDTMVRTMVADGNHDDDVALVCVAFDENGST